MIRLTHQTLQTYHLDQLEESENFDSIKNHRLPSESTKINIPTQKRKADIRNIRQVPTINISNHEIVQRKRVSTVNASSLKHKENLISKEIQHHQLRYYNNN